jgi:uncharacterized protein (DUF1330 family)
MAKGYWIAHVDVSDAEGYKAYVAANAAPFRNFGVRYLVRAGRHETVEGAARSRHVVLEFKDYATALACYPSPEYRQAMALRLPHAVADIMAVEGYDGPQPSGPSEPRAANLGYWIVHVDVTEPVGYQAYMGADMAAFAKFGGRFLVRGGNLAVVEGAGRSRCVLIEFPSYAAALACHRSPEYQAAAALRRGKADFDLIVAEGYDGPQPA